MKIDKTLSEQKIQKILRSFISQPRYSVDGLYVFPWESDKLMWTRAGYIYEFEIKISRSDYKNDFKHKPLKHILLSSKMPKESEAIQQDLFDDLLTQKRKHYPNITKDQLHTYPENTKTPNYFYYAVPEGLLEPDEVPPYAGLIYITTYDGGIYQNEPDKWYHDIKIVRKAPQLHKEKYEDSELNLSEKFYYNMLTAIKTKETFERKHDRMKAQLAEELASKGKDLVFSQLEEEYKKAISERDSNKKLLAIYKSLYMDMVYGADLIQLERNILLGEIKKHDPNFDYKAVIKEADRIYKERYPERYNDD